MFTLAGYSETVTYDVLDFVNVLPDMSLRVYDHDIVVPSLSMLGGCMVGADNLAQAVIYSPSLREINNLNVMPLMEEYGGSILNRQEHCMDFFDRPIVLAEGEALNLKVNTGGNPQLVAGLVWFTDGITPVPEGEWRSIRAYSSTTSGANVWTNVPLTFDEELPVGRYAIIGAAGWDIDMVAFRFVLSGYAWRPGVYGNTGALYPVAPDFRYGHKGLWAEFESDLPPTIDVLSQSANSDHKFVLDLVQIRKGRP